MGYTMTEFIDNRLDKYFSQRDLYAISPFNVDDLRDCILTEIIKDVELFYNCAVEAEKNNVKEVPREKLAPLCAELAMPVAPYFDQVLHTESRFILHRLELVPYVYSDPDELWEEIYDKLYHYFIAKYYITKEIIHKWSMPEYFATHIPRERWAAFFREHYVLRKIYKPKEWNNKRIRYVRKIYETMIKEMPAPKL